MENLLLNLRVMSLKRDALALIRDMVTRPKASYHLNVDKLIQKIYSRESVTTIHNGTTYRNIKAFIKV